METRVSTIVKNNPSELIFGIPELPPGFYTVEVRNRYNNTQQIRTGQLKVSLEVLSDIGAPDA